MAGASKVANQRERLLAVLEEAFQIAMALDLKLKNGAKVGAVLAAIAYELREPLQ